MSLFLIQHLTFSLWGVVIFIQKEASAGSFLILHFADQPEGLFCLSKMDF